MTTTEMESIARDLSTADLQRFREVLANETNVRRGVMNRSPRQVELALQEA